MMDSGRKNLLLIDVTSCNWDEYVAIPCLITCRLPDFREREGKLQLATCVLVEAHANWLS